MIADTQIKFEMGHASFHPTGTIPLDRLADRIGEAVMYCCDREIGKLLVNITEVKGLKAPPFVERCRFADRITSYVTRPIKIALVSPAELISPKRIGIRLARCAGEWCEIFTSETDALQWLLHTDAR